MRNLPVLIAVVILASLLPMPAASQVAQELEEGARVRVWLTPQSEEVEGAAEKQRLRGTILSLSSDSLAVSIHPDAAPVTLAWPRSAGSSGAGGSSPD
jgi:hypothetical protein